VVRPLADGRWGSELRRKRIFERLAEMTGAESVPGYGYIGLQRPGRWFRSAYRPWFAASDQVPERWIDVLERRARPAAVAIYDDRVAQSRALRMELDPAESEALGRRLRRNHEAFHVTVVPTMSFAELTGLDRGRTVAGGNGTDVDRIRPGPWPARPAVGFASGASPGRGIETLIEAVRLVRESIPDCGLLFWLVTTSPSSEAYLAELQAQTSREPWIEIRGAAYDDLGQQLAEATVLAIPHPPGEYFDVALPVKLFDSLAAGRPLVVTPRTETVAVVRETGAGVIGGDDPRELAAAIQAILADEPLARRLGAAARDAAEARFDWRIVGESIGRAVIERVTP
jgi:glycosyltransferase involved in cell wall biosynthesis